MVKKHIFKFFGTNQFGICTLSNLSSRSDFGVKYAEIFIIEKLLPALMSRGVYKIALSNPSFSNR
jgi:hypothetical protein